MSVRLREAVKAEERNERRRTRKREKDNREILAWDHVKHNIQEVLEEQDYTDNYARLADAFLLHIRGDETAETQINLIVRRGLRHIIAEERYEKRKRVKKRPPRLTREQVEREEAEREDRLDASYSRNMNTLIGSVRTAMEEYAQTVLDEWILDNGIKLGDATVEQLRETVGSERELEEGHRKNAEFYARLADMVPEHATGPIRQHVDPLAVERLKCEVYGTDG